MKEVLEKRSKKKRKIMDTKYIKSKGFRLTPRDDDDDDNW